jgi:glucuronokinase
MSVVSRVYARVGLLGNPSDGFYGKTISFSLSNFYAQARGTGVGGR